MTFLRQEVDWDTTHCLMTHCPFTLEGMGITNRMSSPSLGFRFVVSLEGLLLVLPRPSGRASIPSFRTVPHSQTREQELQPLKHRPLLISKTSSGLASDLGSASGI